MTDINIPNRSNNFISKLGKISLSALLLHALQDVEAKNTSIQTLDKEKRSEIMLSTGKIVSLDSVKTTSEYKEWSQHLLENRLQTEINLIENLDTTFLERHFFEETKDVVKIQDSIVNTKKTTNSFNKPFPKLSVAEKKEMEEYLKKHTLLSDILSNKPPMNNIKYIALHSTGTESRNVIAYLQET